MKNHEKNCFPGGTLDALSAFQSSISAKNDRKSGLITEPPEENGGKLFLPGKDGPEVIFIGKKGLLAG